MPILDIFNQDAFSAAALTGNISMVPIGHLEIPPSVRGGVVIP